MTPFDSRYLVSAEASIFLFIPLVFGISQKVLTKVEMLRRVLLAGAGPEPGSAVSTAEIVFKPSLPLGRGGFC